MIPALTYRHQFHTNVYKSPKPWYGVLDGVMYAIGGGCQEHVSSVTLKSVEAYTPIDNVWYHIADMHLCRYNPSVLAFNGLLYVVGGLDGSTHLDSIEIYDPKTNTWTMEPLPISVEVIIGAVVFDMPSHLRTYYSCTTPKHSICIFHNLII